MKNLYIRKYWEEENTWFYFHFCNNRAVRQINVLSDKTILLSTEQPVVGKYILCDQEFEQLDLVPFDCITEEDFEQLWHQSLCEACYRRGGSSISSSELSGGRKL